MSLRTGSRCAWDVRSSALALTTHNPIRDIIENLQIKPNANKSYIPLSVGDPTAFGNLKIADEVLDAVSDCLRVNSSRSYGPTVGHMEARRAVAEYSSGQGRVSPQDVILTSGCAHAIELVVTVLADPGKNILVPRPGYTIYSTLGKGLGIHIKYYDLLPDQNWKVDLASMESQIDDNTVAIAVNNPSNPCGSVYSKEHLLEILDIASRNYVPIIADEIYEHFVFSDHEFFPISSLSVDVPVLTCSGITKRFLVPGWRMGWVIIHDKRHILGKEVRNGLFNMSTRILGPNTLIQRALPRILETTPQCFFDETITFIEKQAKLVCKELERAPGLRPIMPQGSMYMMIEIKLSLFPDIKSELQFVKQLCNEQSVLCIPGQCFNYPGFVRVVLTVPEDVLQEACNRMIAFCNDHLAPPELIYETVGIYDTSKYLLDSTITETKALSLMI